MATGNRTALNGFLLLHLDPSLRKAYVQDDTVSLVFALEVLCLLQFFISAILRTQILFL
jgi:hypothetical protein